MFRLQSFEYRGFNVMSSSFARPVNVGIYFIVH